MKWIRRLFIWFLLLTVLPVLALRWVEPPTSAFMLQRQWDAWRQDQKNFKLEYDWIDWENISRHVPLAVVAAEDQKFPQHWGFDRKQISKALEERKSGKRNRGASTISQQVSKNLFLWPGKNFIRKGIEAYFTVLIELLWSKKRILEVYLNVAQFGDSIFGVGAASRRYFRKPAKRLSKKESALLATALPNPKRLRLDRPSSYMRQRMNRVIDEMDRLDRIKPRPYLWQLASNPE